jgi:dTMP kinase
MMAISTEGTLIILEGADGVGTTTQAKLLFDWLQLKFPATNPLLTAEPTTGPIGTLIRKILNKEISSTGNRGMAALFYADRVEHFELQIMPTLEQGRWVICDRNWQSTLVYQGLTQSLADARWVSSLHRDLIPSSHCFILDVPPELTKRRRRNRDQAEQLYETDPFQACVLNAYKEVPNYDWNSEVISCNSDSVDKVQETIREKLLPLLACKC